MQNSSYVIEDECAEILINTSDDEPRGSHTENEKQMTSFETLVHTALALENDPRNEHSYAFSEKRSFCDGMDKDHSYYFGSKRAHRKIQSLSDENLAEEPSEDAFYDKRLLLPHYQSNDSALDLTGFDSISEKYQSCENVQTMDLCESRCILPGISDTDLSRMSIQSQVEVETLPDTVIGKHSPSDHSYCSNFLENKNDHNIEHTTHTLLRDHAYNAGFHKRDRAMVHTTFRRRDSLSLNTGMKRGHSNDDLSLLSHNFFKKKDFKKSPFLDHSYLSLELQNSRPICRNVRDQNLPRVVTAVKNKSAIMCDTYSSHSQQQTNQNLDVLNSSVMSIMFYQKQPFLDHTYEEFEDASADISLSTFIERVKQDKGIGIKRSAVETMEVKTDKCDHSYVIKSKDCDLNSLNLSSPTPSDSGTESLNEEDELEEIPVTFEMCLKEHPYSKAVKVSNAEVSRHLPT